MHIKVGTDILKKNRFIASWQHGGDAFLEKIFTPQEIRENTIDQLASIFCVKEALVKALEIPGLSWVSISTRRKDNGKVDCSFLEKAIAQKIIALDTSISHDEETTIAVAIVIMQNKEYV